MILIFSSQERCELRYHTAFPVICLIDLIVGLALGFTVHKGQYLHVVISALLSMFYQSLFIVNSYMIIKGIGYKHLISTQNVMLGCSELLFAGAFAFYCKYICRKKKVLKPSMLLRTSMITKPYIVQEPVTFPKYFPPRDPSIV